MILINRTARVLLLLVLGAILCSCSEVGNEPEQSPVLHYFKIQEQAVPVVSRLPGRVTAIMVSEVRPQVDGIIQEKLFTEGAMVAKGQILYQIDPAPYLAARNMAKAELAAAEARAAELELQEKRN